MRTRIIAANWKMNITVSQARDYLNAFIPQIKDVDDREIVIAPPFTTIPEVMSIIKKEGVNITISAQNMHYLPSGALTGEISPLMLYELGVKRVIIGHSERRHIFGEKDEHISKKIASAFEHGLKPILCIGETLQEYEEDKTFQVIETQLLNALKEVHISHVQNLVIAYEPVWAIGTGKNATPAEAQRAHKFIRECLEKRYNSNIASSVRILYGGSVTPENVLSLMECNDVDGVLVGGASLKPDAFSKIVKYDKI